MIETNTNECKRKLKQNRFVIRGAEHLADFFAVAEVTVLRWAKRGPLKGLAYKPNGKTSPLTMLRSDAERVRSQMQRVTQ